MDLRAILRKKLKRSCLSECRFEFADEQRVAREEMFAHGQEKACLFQFSKKACRSAVEALLRVAESMNSKWNSQRSWVQQKRNMFLFPISCRKWQVAEKYEHRVGAAS